MTTYCPKCGGVNGVTADAVATNAAIGFPLVVNYTSGAQTGTVNICETTNATCTSSTLQWCMCKKLELFADQRSHPAY